MVNGMNSNGASAVPSCHGDEAIEWSIANQIMHHPASAPGDVSFSYLMWDSMCAEFHGIVPEHSTRPGRSILIRKCHLHMQFRFVCVVCIEQGAVFQAACFLRCYRIAHKQSSGCTHAHARDSARKVSARSRCEWACSYTPDPTRRQWL